MSYLVNSNVILIVKVRIPLWIGYYFNAPLKICYANEYVLVFDLDICAKRSKATCLQNKQVITKMIWKYGDSELCEADFTAHGLLCPCFCVCLSLLSLGHASGHWNTSVLWVPVIRVDGAVVVVAVWNYLFTSLLPVLSFVALVNEACPAH